MIKLIPNYKTYGGAKNRWGDYSATCVDPTDNLTFWTIQEYAETPAAGKTVGEPGGVNLVPRHQVLKIGGFFSFFR